MSATRAKNHIERKGHIIEVRLAEGQTPESLIALKQAIIQLSQDQPHDILVDVRHAKTSSPEARETADHFFEDLPFRRYAVWGGTPPVNLGIRFLLEEQEKDGRIRMFRREEDARAWLEEKSRG